MDGSQVLACKKVNLTWAVFFFGLIYIFDLILSFQFYSKKKWKPWINMLFVLSGNHFTTIQCALYFSKCYLMVMHSKVNSRLMRTRACERANLITLCGTSVHSHEVHCWIWREFKTWQPNSAFAFVKLSPSVGYFKEAHTQEHRHTDFPHDGTCVYHWKVRREERLTNQTR